jgi:hypothetical protein
MKRSTAAQRVKAPVQLVGKSLLRRSSSIGQRYGIGSPMLNDCCRARRRPAGRVCSRLISGALLDTKKFGLERLVCATYGSAHLFRTLNKPCPRAQCDPTTPE